MALEVKRVLVVEDDPVVAMVVEDALRDMGVDVVIDLTLIDALTEIETTELDAALVDIGLRGENARPLLLALRERELPFAAMSGGDLSAITAEFPGIPTISKPVDLKQLQDLVRQLLA